MKCVRKKNDNGSWHKMHDEMPPTTSDVEVKTSNGTIITAEIIVDMAGFYIYLRDIENWGSLDDYTHWRYRTDK